MRLPTRLLKQSVQLLEATTTTSLDGYGQQAEATTWTVRWEGKASVQPRLEDRERGYFITREEDVEQFVTPYLAYLPAEAAPEQSWYLKNLDTGDIHEQLTRPKNPAGQGAYWQLHLSNPTRRT